MSRVKESTRNGGRPPTGSIKWADAAKTIPLGVRVTKANGKRKLVRFDLGTTPDDARALAPILAQRARDAVDDEAGITVSEYAERWHEWRESRGLGCVENDRGVLARHVLPTVGALEMAAVTRDDLKRLVSLLDATVKRGFTVDENEKRRPFGWKTAMNAWAVVRALFRDARGAKRVDLCVREDNPAEGVAGPDTGPRKAKVYLWPSEFGALVSCDRVPHAWRRMFAITTYLYARAGEVNALQWEDLDLDRGVVHIHHSVDRNSGAVKSTKTREARRVPIEPELMPTSAQCMPSRAALAASWPHGKPIASSRANFADASGSRA
jgi:integrase